jgi:hypothetical protein
MRHVRYQWLAGLLLLPFFLGGCDLLVNHPVDGSLQLSIAGAGNSARSIGPEISVDVNHYVIRGESVAGELFEQTTPEDQVVIRGLTAGYWDVTVDAFNESDVHLYTGTVRILVEGGVSLPVMVSLAAVSGVGTLTIAVTWPEGEILSPTVDAVLVPTIGDPLPLVFAIDGAAASFSGDQIDSGFHTLVLKVKEDDMIVAGGVDLVQIVRGQVTSANLVFEQINAPGSLEIEVEVAPEFAESLSVTIDGGEGVSDFGVPVTLLGAVEGNPGNTVFTWYVNGSAVDSGTASTEISGDVPGHFRVDLLVITADGGDGGTATTWVEIAEPAP